MGVEIAEGFNVVKVSIREIDLPLARASCFSMIEDNAAGGRVELRERGASGG
jgi:hypothetical protein